MKPEDKAEIVKLIKQVLKEELPKLLGRSLVQVKTFLIKNIT